MGYPVHESRKWGTMRLMHRMPPPHPAVFRVASKDPRTLNTLIVGHAVELIPSQGLAL